MSMYVFWDIDGTLIRNATGAGSLYLDSIEIVTGTRPTVAVPNPHGMTEGQLLTAILEANGHGPEHLVEVLEELDVLSLARHEAGDIREACIGVDAVLTAIARRGWVNAILTGNGPRRARWKLMSAGIDIDTFGWDHSHFGHLSPTRQHLTGSAKAALGAEDKAMIIGDTPNDGLAATAVGIPFIAVATGMYTAEELRDTTALVVIDDLVSGYDTLLEVIGTAFGVEKGQ
ncbi:MAG: HAD family hydrolase [Rhodoglobus sp.]